MLASKTETLSYSDAILTIVLDKFQSQKAQVVCGEQVKTPGVACRSSQEKRETYAGRLSHYMDDTVIYKSGQCTITSACMDSKVNWPP